MITVRTLEPWTFDILCTFLFDDYEIKALLKMYILSILKCKNTKQSCQKDEQAFYGHKKNVQSNIKCSRFKCPHCNNNNHLKLLYHDIDSTRSIAQGSKLTTKWSHVRLDFQMWRLKNHVWSHHRALKAKVQCHLSGAYSPDHIH